MQNDVRVAVIPLTLIVASRATPQEAAMSFPFWSLGGTLIMMPSSEGQRILRGKACAYMEAIAARFLRTPYSRHFPGTLYTGSSVSGKTPSRQLVNRGNSS